jgi:hypothetical protein
LFGLDKLAAVKRKSDSQNELSSKKSKVTSYKDYDDDESDDSESSSEDEDDYSKSPNNDTLDIVGFLNSKLPCFFFIIIRPPFSLPEDPSNLCRVGSSSGSTNVLISLIDLHFTDVTSHIFDLLHKRSVPVGFL